MMWIKEITILIVAYFVGCMTTGYYIVKYSRGIDVRAFGSMGLGATNVARILGWPGFVLVFALDFVRGVLVLSLAQWLQLSVAWQGLILIAAILGHIMPVQLRFHGGKGVAIALGGLLVWDFAVFCGLWLVYGVTFIITRRHKFAGAAAILSVLPWALLLQQSKAECLGLLAIVMIVLYAHWHYDVIKTRKV